MEPNEARRDTISLLDAIAVVLRRRWIIVGITLGVALIAVIVLATGRLLPPSSPLNLTPDWYTPTVKVLLQETSSTSSVSDVLRSSGLSSIANLAGLGALSKRSNAELAKDLLRTTTLLDAVVDDLDIVERYGITEEPRTRGREAITDRLSVNYKETSGVMTIGFSEEDPEFAARAVTRIVEELATQFRRLTLDQVSLKRQYLEAGVAAQTVEADRASRQMLAFQGRYGMLDVSAQVSEAARSLTQLQSQITAKNLELKVQQRFLPEGDARIAKLKGEIEELQNLMAAAREGSPAFGTAAISQEELPELQLEYATLKREVELQQQILVALKQQLELARLEELSTAANFQIVEQAEVLEAKTGPSRGLTVVIATFAGGVLALLVAFVVDHFDRAAREPSGARRIAAIREALSQRRRPPKGPNRD